MDSIVPSDDTPRKQCCDCKEWFPATRDFFNKNGKRLRYECKKCSAKRRKIYNADPINKEKNKIRNAKWEQEHKEERLQYHHQHYWNNPEARRESARRSNEKRPIEERRAYDIQYRQSEHGKQVSRDYEKSEKGRAVRKATNHKRRVGAHFRRNSFTAQQFLEQLKRQKYCCSYCGEKHTEKDFEWHAEHIVPLSRGGTNDISNVVAVCRNCNLSKGKKLPHEWPQGGRLL